MNSAENESCDESAEDEDSSTEQDIVDSHDESEAETPATIKEIEETLTKYAKMCRNLNDSKNLGDLRRFFKGTELSRDDFDEKTAPLKPEVVAMKRIFLREFYSDFLWEFFQLATKNSRKGKIQRLRMFWYVLLF